MYFFGQLKRLYVHYLETGQIKSGVIEAVNFGVVLNGAGEFIELASLCQVDQNGKEQPQLMYVPEHGSRSSDIVPFFLFDNSKYIFGFDGKSKDKAVKRFDAARKFYHTVLDGLDNKRARSLLTFYDNWDPETAELYPLFHPEDRSEENSKKKKVEFIKTLYTANFVFIDENGKPLFDDREIMRAYQDYIGKLPKPDPCECFDTFEPAVPARTHRMIK